MFMSSDHNEYKTKKSKDTSMKWDSTKDNQCHLHFNLVIEQVNEKKKTRNGTCILSWTKDNKLKIYFSE